MENPAEKSIIEEATLGKIRNLINVNQIKLWLHPYYDQDTKVSQADKMLDTANALAPELNMEVGDVYQGLLKLQTNAVDKLSARDLLAKSNQIELKIKLDKRAKQINPESGHFIKVRSKIIFDVQSICSVCSMYFRIRNFKICKSSLGVKSKFLGNIYFLRT